MEKGEWVELLKSDVTAYSVALLEWRRGSWG